MAAVVDAFDLAWVVALIDRDCFAVFTKDLRHVGQVIFPLSVVVADAFECSEKLFGVKAINSRVDLVDFSFLIRSVFLLNDPLKCAVSITHDATVSCWIF